MIKLGTEDIFNIPTIKKAYLDNDLIYKKYTELDYIESTGTQWIDTLLSPRDASSVKIEIKAMFTDTNGTRQLMGANSNPYFGIDSNGNYEIYVNSSIHYSQDNYDIIEYLGEIVNSHINATLNVNGEEAVSTQKSASAFSNPNLYLFRLNYNTPFYCKTKLKYCKIWFNNNLLGDFIPVLDKNSNPCLYDKISNKFFYNKGSGNFIAGPKKLHYIETSGTQYINTGVVGSNNTKIEVEFMTTQVISNTAHHLVGNILTTSRAISFNMRNISTATNRWGNKTYVGNLSLPANTRYHLDMSADGYYLDEELLCSFEANTFTTNGNIYLGTATTSSGFGLNGKIYSCKIYENNVLVRYFIPMIDSNNIPCFYDEISNTFFYNIGTGDFLYG